MAINNRELRIGNIVSENILGECIVCELHSSYALLDNDYTKERSSAYSINYDNIEPILITPEILAQCGFYAEFEEDINECVLFFNNPVHLDLVDGRFMEDEFNIEIKYLHQLQNFYYAVKNEELTYTKK